MKKATVKKTAGGGILALGGLLALGLYSLSRGKPVSAAPAVRAPAARAPAEAAPVGTGAGIRGALDAGRQGEANTQASLLIGRSAVAVPSAAPTVITETIKSVPNTPIVVAAPVSSKQVQDAVMAAIAASDDTGSEPPNITFTDGPAGVSVTMAVNTFEQAAAVSGMSVKDWGHQGGFW